MVNTCLHILLLLCRTYSSTKLFVFSVQQVSAQIGGSSHSLSLAPEKMSYSGL